MNGAMRGKKNNLGWKLKKKQTTITKEEYYFPK